MSVADPGIRLAQYRKLTRHNRWIGFLRVAVPVLGVLVLFYPLFQFSFAMVVPSIEIDGVRLQSDTLVVDGPRFEGRTATGTVYRMVAARSESAVGNLDISDLYDLRIDLDDGADYRAQVAFSTAQWTMSVEYLTSNEDVFVSDTTGARGVLAGAQVDWPAQIISSDGPVRFSFDDETTLNAQAMVHDIAKAHWLFTGVSLDMMPAPDAGQDRDPHVLENIQ